MKVLKFGGSSLADANQFKKVRDIILEDSDRKIVVVSAPGKGTNNKHKITDLLLMCHQLASHSLNFDEVFNIVKFTYEDIVKNLHLEIDIDEILSKIRRDVYDGASSDYTASRGEYVNAMLMADFLGWNFVDAKDIIFFKDGHLDDEKTEMKIREVLEDKEYSVIPGFYGSDEFGNIKTFSRGGSDITGSLVANALVADIYENWTDVPGFLVADPKIVKGSRTIDKITYKELRELSYMGAPVLHEEAIFPVKKHQIPINIRNTNDPENDGTTIISEYDGEIENTITGIAGKKDYTVINIEKSHMSSDLSFFRKLSSVFETNDIQVEHMPTSIDSISIIVKTESISSKLKKVIEEIKIYTNPDNVSVDDGLALLAVVGRGMVKTRGTSGKIFTALADKKINVRMISQGASELNIIIGIENKDFEEAIIAIYNAFEED